MGTDLQCFQKEETVWLVVENQFIFPHPKYGFLPVKKSQSMLRIIAGQFKQKSMLRIVDGQNKIQSHIKNVEGWGIRKFLY